jgi:hypothetical protein
MLLEKGHGVAAPKLDLASVAFDVNYSWPFRKNNYTLIELAGTLLKDLSSIEKETTSVYG